MKVPKKISTVNKREAVDTREVIQISQTIWNSLRSCTSTNRLIAVSEGERENKHSSHLKSAY